MGFYAIPSAGFLTFTSAGFRTIRSTKFYRLGSVDDSDRLYEATNQRLFATLVRLVRDRAAAVDCPQEAYLKAFRVWPRWGADAPRRWAWKRHRRVAGWPPLTPSTRRPRPP